MVTADIKKNRLLLKMPKTADEQSLNMIYNDLQSCITDLNPGFQVIADMSNCRVIFLRGLPTFKKMLDCFLSNKVGEVVKVIDNSKVSYKQISRFFSSIKCYKTVDVNSLNDAEIVLEIYAKRNGIRFILNNPVVEYVTDEGSTNNGYVLDISISGCAIDSETNLLAGGEEVTLTINFDKNPNLITSFQVLAKVVRSEGRMFAVQFLNLDEKLRERLYERLAYESGRPI